MEARAGAAGRARGRAERAALTLLAALASQLLAALCFSPAWLLFGFALGHIWGTFLSAGRGGDESTVLYE